MKFLPLIFVIVVGIAILSIIVLNIQQQKNTKIMPRPADSASLQGQVQQNTNSSFLNANTLAPELTSITAWLNPDKPLTLKSLHGKVVLVDFWTNQCINCIHTLPYVTKWYDTYKDQGFVVIGVHAPELAFEHTVSSIQTAIQTYGIHYPVAQDNDYKTWNAYNNQYWPALYLIDKKGTIRRTHFGEGEYSETELAIQTLLKE